MDTGLKKLWQWFWRPGSRYSVGTLLVVGGVGGILFWGGFNTFVEYSNTGTFCISCHEMRSTVYEEYKQTIHYKNTSGVQAVCADCHVPKEWSAKMTRKIQATFREVPHAILGTINTPEKFEAKRLQLAEHVWASMRETDSRECRNCHDPKTMTLATQRPRARAQHEDAVRTGETCIDCHQGIAHKMPAQPSPAGDGDFSL